MKSIDHCSIYSPLVGLTSLCAQGVKQALGYDLGSLENCVMTLYRVPQPVPHWCGWTCCAIIAALFESK